MAASTVNHISFPLIPRLSIYCNSSYWAGKSVALSLHLALVYTEWSTLMAYCVKKYCDIMKKSKNMALLTPQAVFEYWGKSPADLLFHWLPFQCSSSYLNPYTILNTDTQAGPTARVVLLSLVSVSVSATVRCIQIPPLSKLEQHNALSGMRSCACLNVEVHWYSLLCKCGSVVSGDVSYLTSISCNTHVDHEVKM